MYTPPDTPPGFWNVDFTLSPTRAPSCSLPSSNLDEGSCPETTRDISLEVVTFRDSDEEPFSQESTQRLAEETTSDGEGSR